MVVCVDESQVYIGSVRDVPLDFASRCRRSAFYFFFGHYPSLRCFLCGPKLSVSVRVPGGNEQMAHSQIVVVIAFSLTFEMDVALVFHRRPLGNAGFHCRFSIAVYHHLSEYVIVSLAGASFGFLQLTCIC